MEYIVMDVLLFLKFVKLVCYTKILSLIIYLFIYIYY